MEESETDTIVNGGEDEEVPVEIIEEDATDHFTIPTLPRGSLLSLRLLSNWGDATSIGLAGVEIFFESGRRAVVTEVTTSALTHQGELRSVGDLSGFGHSSWCAPVQGALNGEMPLSISLQLEEKEQAVAMLRVWNYNESRVHASRGVREIEIDLDNALIFRGVISPAYDGDEADTGETILFTTNDVILESIAENDVCLLPASMRTSLAIRPSSAVDRIVPQRPITAERSSGREEERKKKTSREKSLEGGREETGVFKVLQFTLESTWGIREVLGLTGIEFFDAPGDALPAAAIASVTVEGGEGDVSKLINGRNLTRSKEDMWLTPFDPSSPPTLTFTFVKPVSIAGVSIWNYNGSVELSYAGVRNVRIHAGGKTKRRVVLRKAIGYVFFDFVQDVTFDRRAELAHAAIDRPMSKCANGFIYQLCLLSTWGDEFYVGLNGIELRDDKDQPIRVKANNLAAFPESVNILPQVKDDPRRSENLINGVNDQLCASNSWLTPQLPNRCARVFFVFDLPTFISKIVIYNYRKTPARGVRHLSISVDDDIIWSGEIPRGSEEEEGRLEIGLRESHEP